MKLVFMTYYVGMHREVEELIERCGVVSYTHWAQVTGRLSCGEPRQGSDVWPGYNTAVQAVLREETADRVAEAIRKFNGEQRGDERIDAYFVDLHSTIRAATESDTACIEKG
jgi:hypothetical protein